MGHENDNLEQQGQNREAAMGQFREDKLKELIIYVAEKCMEDPTFGATKLSKILYFADFLTCGERGVAITGATYIKLPRGPVPQELASAQDDLEKSGAIRVRKVPYYAYMQHRIIPIREAKLDLFSAEEIALVDAIIQKLWGVNAADISHYTHRLAGWRIAEDGDVIPYESVFLSDERLTEDDIRRAKELANRLGWVA